MAEPELTDAQVFGTSGGASAPPGEASDQAVGLTPPPPPPPNPNWPFLSPQTADELRNRLAPDPGRIYSEYFPVSTDPKTGEPRWAIPGMVSQGLTGVIDLLQGPGGMQVHPDTGVSADRNVAPTGTMTLTPDATLALTNVATPLRFGGAGPRVFEPPGILDPGAGLSPEFKAAPFASERAGPGTQAGPSLPGFGPAMQQAPTTADEARAIASSLYTRAAAQGGTLTPQFTNKFIDSLAEAGPKTEFGATVPGSQVAKDITDSIKNFRDQPLTLDAVQEFDERIGKLINADYKANRGLSDTGQELLDIQQKLRSQIQNAGAGDVAGGDAGFQALSQARQAYSQAMKMRDLENVQYRADATDNPATSYKTQLNTILNNAKSRGYTDGERAAVENARDRGAIGGTLQFLGSSIPALIAGFAEAGTHGVTGGLAAAAATKAVTPVFRGWAGAWQRSKLGQALEQMGSSVPLNPLTPPWLPP